MWWYTDLPAAMAGPGPAETPPEAAQGEFLLEWILPTLEATMAREADAGLADADGGARRALRRDLRDDP